MNFKKIYLFPLKLDVFGDIVLTSDNDRAFDFYEDMTEGYVASNQLQKAVVDCLNSDEYHLLIEDTSFIYKDAIISIVAKNNSPQPFIIIRGWGHLTGTGGLRLSESQAKQIQDEFAHFIIDKLSTYKKEV